MLLDKNNVRRLVRRPSSLGMGPLMSQWSRLRVKRFDSIPSSVGLSPCNETLAKNNTFEFVRKPISVGIVPTSAGLLLNEIRSSSTASPTSLGIVPLNQLWKRNANLKVESKPISVGKVPEIKFPGTYKCSNFDHLSIPCGSGLLNLLSFKNNCFRAVVFVSSLGIDPFHQRLIARHKSMSCTQGTKISKLTWYGSYESIIPEMQMNIAQARLRVQ